MAINSMWINRKLILVDDDVIKNLMSAMYDGGSVLYGLESKFSFTATFCSNFEQFLIVMETFGFYHKKEKLYFSYENSLNMFVIKQCNQSALIK